MQAEVSRRSRRAAERGDALLGSDPTCSEEDPRRDDAEDEAADVSEERHAAAMRSRTEHPEVPFDELVEKPAAEEDPCRDAYREPADEGEDARVAVQDEVGAEHRGNSAAGAEVRHRR